MIVFVGVYFGSSDINLIENDVVKKFGKMAIDLVWLRSPSSLGRFVVLGVV